jgi:hypothetical protein
MSVGFKLLLFRHLARFLSYFFLTLSYSKWFSVFFWRIKRMEREKLSWIEMILRFAVVNEFLWRDHSEIGWRIDHLVLYWFQINKAFLYYVLNRFYSWLRITSFIKWIIKGLKVLFYKLSNYLLIDLLQTSVMKFHKLLRIRIFNLINNWLVTLTQLKLLLLFWILITI